MSSVSKKGKLKSAPSVSFFFGAGAEVGYGMPVGGRFALEILKAARPEAEFQHERERVADGASQEYRAWLPEKFAKARPYWLTQTERNRVFDHSLTSGFESIIGALNDYDSRAESFLRERGYDHSRISELFAEASDGLTFGATPFKNVQFNRQLSGEPASLFRSKYFSAIALLATHGQERALMTNLARSTIQFYLGAHGQGTMNTLAINPLLNTPEDNPAFDQLGRLFDMNPVDAGVAAFEAVMDDKIDVSQTTDDTLFSHIAVGVLESAVQQFLDYREIVDGLIPALYDPKHKWARFTKIMQFLMATRAYVSKHEQIAMNVGQGYYHDLAAGLSAGTIRVTAIGTSNYTSLCAKALSGKYKGRIYHLNGSLGEYLDPFKNEIFPASERDQIPRFLAPFLFTQSGVKPITSVEVSRRYVDYHDAVTKDKTVVSVGFGFNGDDGHINSLLRQAVEKHGTRIVQLQHAPSGKLDLAKTTKIVADKLRLDSAERITVLPVDNYRKVNGRPWIDALIATLTNEV